ncbi:hypothetical protein ISS04_01895 [Candidatus Woesearchaeota archaeon]|nr:hypothetical protein [Candidatus Woesearchaeota archaeon]
MMKSNKAQIAIEFLFVIGVILLLSTFVLYDVFNKKDQVTKTTDILNKKDFCLQFSSLITEIYASGVGTIAYFSVGVGHIKYNVTVQPISRNLFVGEPGKGPVYCTYPIRSVSNSSQERNLSWFNFHFSADKRILKFENIGGFVVISLHNRSVYDEI